MVEESGQSVIHKKIENEQVSQGNLSSYVLSYS